MTKFVVTAGVLVLIMSAACGSSDESTSATVAAPSNLKVEPLEGGAHVTWKDNSENEASFMIERMNDKADWKTIGTVPFDTTQYHDATITAGTTYMYRVMAMPKSGNHAAGGISSAVTFVAPADATGSTANGAAGAGGEHSGHGT